MVVGATSPLLIGTLADYGSFDYGFLLLASVGTVGLVLSITRLWDSQSFVPIWIGIVSRFGFLSVDQASSEYWQIGCGSVGFGTDLDTNRCSSH